MTSKMNRSSFEELIRENIAWLEKQPRTLERNHIIEILHDAPKHYYECAETKAHAEFLEKTLSLLPGMDNPRSPQDVMDLMSRLHKAEEEVEQLKKELTGQIIHTNWGIGDFYGPCAHGRDPYTRCDDCGDLEPRQALVRTIAEKQRARDAKAAKEWAQKHENMAELKKQDDLWGSAENHAMEAVMSHRVAAAIARAPLIKEGDEDVVEDGNE